MTFLKLLVNENNVTKGKVGLHYCRNIQCKNIQQQKGQFISANQPVFTKWMDKQDVMKEFYVSGRTLYNWRKRKYIPLGRIGNKIYYARTARETPFENPMG